MNIKPIADNIFKSSITTLNEVGKRTCDIANNSIRRIGSQLGQVTDKFQLSELSEFAKKNDIRKETAIGTAVCAVGILLAGKCLKGIKKALCALRKDI